MARQPALTLEQALRAELLNPYPRYRRMRRQSPVLYDPRSNSWHVFRYDDVVRVLSDARTFSSHFRGRLQTDVFKDTVLDLDPPRHHQMRSLVDQAFTHRAVDAMAPMIRALAHTLLDRVLPHGRMEVMADLAYPLPVMVIADMLGIPQDAHGQFKEWSDALATAGPTLDSAVREMSEYFDSLTKRQSNTVNDSLIGRLLAARIGDERLTSREIVDFCGLLLVAGHETTTHLITNTLIALTDHPDAWERLRTNPALVPSTVEEVLRYRSPVSNMARETTTDVAIAGQTIPAGALVAGWIGSANRDETKFTEPDRFDIERSPNPHIAFGRGSHYCLGASLARLEMATVLTALVERVRSFTRVPEIPLEPLPSPVIYGVRELHLALVPN